MKNINTLLVLLLFCLRGISQPDVKAIDSVNRILLTTTVDTVKLSALLKLGQLYTGMDTTLGFTFCYMGLEKAKQLNDKNYQSEFFLRLGKLHFNSKNNDSALYYLNACISNLNASMRSYLHFESYCELGNAYWKKGDYEKSMDALLTAEKNVKPPDEAAKLSRLYYIMGGVMMDLNKPEKALDYSLKCIKILEDNNLYQQLAKTYSSCGGLYFMNDKPTEALAMFKKGLALAIKLNDDQSYTQATMNMGTYYNEIDDLDSALYYYNLSRKRHLKNGNADNQFPVLLLNIANVLDQQKKYTEAEQTYLLADSLANIYAFVRTKLSCKKYLAALYTRMGEWEKAYNTLESFHQLKDSLTNEESNRATLELEQKYNVTQKQKEIALLQKDKENQQVIKNAIVAVAILAVLIGLILFFGFRNRGRLNKQLADKNVIIDTARERAERNEQFKQQFLANMSHELRSPMNAILGAVNLASNEVTSETAKKYLLTAKKSSINLLGIINDILDLSKIETGNLTLEHIPFSIAELVEDCISLHQLSLKSERQHLDFKSALAADFYVNGDPLRLNQVLTNLISNALKFTPEGTVVVALSEQQSDNTSTIKIIKINVTDNGIGMSANQVKSIFETYTQATSATSRKFGGTGLGLAITKQLVDLMQGTIEVTSQLEQGTTFTLTLPLEAATAPKNTAPEKDNKALNDVHSLNGITILIADDLEENLFITKDILNAVLKNATIKTAANGKEVINYLESKTTDEIEKTIVLLDLDMPVMNGFQAIKIIREQMNLRLPVIALTASVFIGNEKEFKDFGFDGLILKPFVPANLIAAMASLIKK